MKAEQRTSRLKLTRQFILKNNLSGKLNNIKWYNLFDVLSKSGFNFEIKTLLESNFRLCKEIYELEDTSVLIDHTGNFIEFFEIETLILPNNSEIEIILNELHLDYMEEDGKLVLTAYL